MDIETCGAESRIGLTYDEAGIVANCFSRREGGGMYGSPLCLPFFAKFDAFRRACQANGVHGSQSDERIWVDGCHAGELAEAFANYAQSPSSPARRVLDARPPYDSRSLDYLQAQCAEAMAVQALQSLSVLRQRPSAGRVSP